MRMIKTRKIHSPVSVRRVKRRSGGLTMQTIPLRVLALAAIPLLVACASDNTANPGTGGSSGKGGTGGSGGGGSGGAGGSTGGSGGAGGSTGGTGGGGTAGTG